MKYNFDKVVNRRNTASLKWDILKENELPMWVADMDFEAAPEIVEALQLRLNGRVYGYNIIPDEWYSAYINWWKERHNFELQRDWLIFSTGVIPTISSVVRKLTTPNENVLIQTPVYNIFFNSIINNGCRVLQNKLVYENGSFSIDFEDLENKLSDPQTSLMLLCNPQNPTGRIWTREELAKIGALCKKYNVVVVSDEIHCDITDIGSEYVPFASVNDECKMNSITCIAPTKCFNIAGLHTSAVSVPNPFLRHKVNRALNTDEVAEPNTFAVTAAVAAFEKGGSWLDEMRSYVQQNKLLVNEFIKENIPSVKTVNQNATYLLWLDVSSLGISSELVAKKIREKSGLVVSEGTEYGSGGENFIRLNIACPRTVLLEGLARLKRGLE